MRKETRRQTRLNQGGLRPQANLGGGGSHFKAVGHSGRRGVGKLCGPLFMGMVHVSSKTYLTRQIIRQL